MIAALYQYLKKCQSLISIHAEQELQQLHQLHQPVLLSSHRFHLHPSNLQFPHQISTSSSPTSSFTSSTPLGISLPAPPHSSATMVNVIAGSLIGLGFYIMLMLINL
ncbi:Hypothetical predicted protein [Olea europaea subsp. europaea]|uniref:Uncharacterized protein n=1 Tax=Olea europaea subsp. europaea TaxID=158383 RepID=A0A8S0V813_OLEEU|nr:Hypothetical predicted protein [Olea europaea subsp. europaea]